MWLDLKHAADHSSTAHWKAFRVNSIAIVPFIGVVTFVSILVQFIASSTILDHILLIQVLGLLISSTTITFSLNCKLLLVARLPWTSEA
ncbi:hypothetical protein CF326_g7926 [Tilletia indica]|nr:hypothetical protein CF326_g7926 [Tilletia indica]